MNTLDDLRSTLRREADGVDDSARYARPVAVRERIRGVRRRRAAVAASAAVVLVAVAATAVGDLLGEHRQVEPATQVVGVDVPQRVAVYGFPYELTGTEPFTGPRDRLRLQHAADADRWRAVSLVASGLGGGYATLYLDGQPVARAAGADDVEVPVPVFDGEPTLRVELDGAPAEARAGVAIYGATGDLPNGVTNGTAVFRDEVAGSRLQAGAFSEPGDSSVSVPFSGRIADGRIAYYCHTRETGLWLNVATDEGGVLGTSCGADVDVDAGDGGSNVSGSGSAGSHVLRAYLTRGERGPRVAPPDAVLGVAVYDDPVAPQSVLGTDVATTVELDGRLWTLDRVVRQGQEGSPVRAEVDASDGDRVVGQVAAGETTWITWHGRLLDGESTRMGSDPGVDSTGTVVDSYLPRGDTYQVTLHGQGGTPFRGALLVYRPM